MSQQTIQDESCFTHRNKVDVNNNFTELYGLATTFRRGNIYYVDNVTGSANNSGLGGWGNAFAEVTTAITASETYRLAQADVYIRNLILIQGTATSYATLTAFPNYTDLVGIGGSYTGDQSGTVVIGASTTSNGTNALEMRGSTFYNMQFRGGGSGQSAFKASKVLRCVFEDCAFYNKGLAGDAGFYIYTLGGHNRFKHCSLGDTNATFTYGLYVPTGLANWDHCLVEDCLGFGSTAAYFCGAYLQDSTLVKNNTFIGGTYGIRDTSTESTVAGNSFYINNRCYGSTSTSQSSAGIVVDQNPTVRCIGNICSDGGTGHNQIALV